MLVGGQLAARLSLSLSTQHEAAHTEPLDELYEALAEVLATDESAQCHRSYLLVRDLRPPPSQAPGSFLPASRHLATLFSSTRLFSLESGEGGRAPAGLPNSPPAGSAQGPAFRHHLPRFASALTPCAHPGVQF